MIDVIPVILCGGTGSRLWPLSRSGFPKQFLSITHNESLFQLAATRLLDVANDDINVSNPVLVTNEEYRFLASEQLKESRITPQFTLLEPQGRNTAPALALSAFAALAGGGDPILVVTPADQTIQDCITFEQAIRLGINKAVDGGLVVFGVPPNKPETGYGYIQVSDESIDPPFFVERFVEKPTLDKAKQYIQEGGYFWNAGIFVLKASVWLSALKKFRPDIFEATQNAWVHRTVDSSNFQNFIRFDVDLFAQIPAESIDYAVMEKCPESDIPINVVPLDAGWSDLGSWDAVWNSLPKDGKGNACKGDVLTLDSSNNLVHAATRLVSLVGVDDLVVVETPDAILIADKARCQNVKAIVSDLQNNGRTEQMLHRKVFRPWGWYDSLDVGTGFQVKRISVHPGASLSLQLHHRRAEHWVVVKGVAQVTRGTETFILSANQSTYIPMGEIHRLSNPSDEELEIIEVQSGEYLGEDDIVRLEDSYGRE